uniref:Uncharacterized protein n=1 Tax=Anguilla anguilla TaxID=7936 RepID=A0A0E9WD89_ANGAN
MEQNFQRVAIQRHKMDAVGFLTPRMFFFFWISRVNLTAPVTVSGTAGECGQVCLSLLTYISLL